MIVGREMIDDLPDPEPIEEKKYSKNGSHDSHGSHGSHGSLLGSHGSLARRFSRPVPLRVEFNRNRETETNKNERITKTNGRSMKHRNADNGIISTFVKLSFLSLSVMRQI